MKPQSFFVVLSLILHVLFIQGLAQNHQDASLIITVTNLNNELVSNVSAKLSGFQEYSSAANTREQPIFQKIRAGEYTLDISAEGYKFLSKKIKINSGKNTLFIQLELAEITETVEVKRDETSALIDNAFTGFFTKAQIEALPETGEEIERELKRRYGPDVIIKVDGFSDRIPDKSKIASIKATQSSYDAENHELGYTYVEISTKVGEESFGGTFLYDFNNNSLNARSPLSKVRLPDSKNNFSFSLFGPIVQKRTAFDIHVSQINFARKNNIIARFPNGQIPSAVSFVEQGLYLDPRIHHNLSKNHTLKLGYTFENLSRINQGVGDFDLPERAFSTRLNTHRITLSESGYFNDKYFNEFRLFYKLSRRATIAENDAPTIRVLDTFTSGGAGNNSENTEQSFWLADNFLFSYKNHAVKIGGLFELQQAREISKFNNRGTFIFSSLNDFNTNKPALFTQTPEPRSSDVTVLRAGIFVQDDFKIKKNLGISLGLRYEAQNRISDFNNFSPRLGVTWVPPQLKRTVIRGGIGVFYNWVELSAFNYLENRSIFQPSEITIVNPGFPGIQFASAPNYNSSILSYWKLREDTRNAAIVHSSFGVNNNLGKNTQLQINYVFQKGTKMLRSTDSNFPVNGVRPDQNFSNIFQVESTGFYVLNKLDVNYSSIFKRGIVYGLHYTLQKKTSDSEGIFSFPSNNLNLRDDVAPANDDQRHRISGNLSWKVRKGLLLSAVYNIESPLPYTITTGFDNNRDSIFNDRPFGIKRNSERGTWRKQVDFGFSYTKSFWSYGKERKGKVQLIYTRGEIARDNETIEDNKRFQAKFYASVFNLFNSSNFNSFVGVQTSPLFRQPISATVSRRIDMGIRFGF